jgi:iron complex outermembrane recepter protein
MLLSALASIVLSTTAAVQTSAATGASNLSIPAEPLADALNDLAQQSGLQVLFASELVARFRSPEVKGLLTAEEALQQLLINTGLRFEFVNSRTITIFGTAKPGQKTIEPTVETNPPEMPRPKDQASNNSDQPGKNTMPRRNLLARLLGLSAVCGSALHGGVACADDAAASATASDQRLETIIVTARKRDESLAQVPISVSVFTFQALQDYDIQSFNDYATKIPNLSFAYGNGPSGITEARNVMIRGISGQNGVTSAGATGFYIDDTPLASSIDPRVLDIENIEVLKGPQGTLYGETSLGGNIRLVTKKPNLTEDGLSYMAEGGLTSGGGSADGGGNVIGNFVVVPNSLAVRVVLFANHDAGYLTRTFPNPTSPGVTDPFLLVPRQSVDNQGAVSTFGGSISALQKVTENFGVTFRVMYQNTDYSGFPVGFAPLPSFTPDYTLDRAFDVQPHASDVWALPSLELKYTGAGWTFTSSSSYFYRHTEDVEDATYGTQQAFANFYGVTTLPPQPFLWNAQHFNNQVSEEMRVSFEPINNLSGTIGAFYSHSDVSFKFPPTYATGLVAATANNTVVGTWPNDLIWVQDNTSHQQDESVFGELYYKFLSQFTLTLGARQYWLTQDSDYTANGFLNFGPTPSAPTHNTQKGTDPKVGVSYQATDEVMVYTSASKGFRAGGAQPAYVSFCSQAALPASDITYVKSDTLWSYEIGTKIQVPQPNILVSAAVFHINWQNIQQQVALPCGSIFTVNGNDATVTGGELEIDGHVTPSLQMRFGAGYERTDITDPGPLGLAGIQPGSRILGTPALTASIGAVYTRHITSSVDGFGSADYSYTGNSISLLNSGAGLEATRPGYSLVNVRVGTTYDKSEVSLNLRNVTNSKPNLGDIGYNGYAQFNSAGGLIPQVATLQPFTVILQYRRNF